jgi:hypothetical protein
MRSFLKAGTRHPERGHTHPVNIASFPLPALLALLQTSLSAVDGEPAHAANAKVAKAGGGEDDGDIGPTVPSQENPDKTPKIKEIL